MDIKTLKVGQNVYMVSGASGTTGRVIRVTPEGVDVAAYGLSYSDILTEVFHFNKEGHSRDGTREGGPWELDEMPYEERMALNEQASREGKVRKKLIDEGVDVRMWRDWEEYKKTHKLEFEQADKTKQD